MLAAMDAGRGTRAGSGPPPPATGPDWTTPRPWRLALAEAAAAPAHGDVPVGAVALVDGRVVASRHNERELTGRPDGPRRDPGPGRRRRRTRAPGASTEVTLVVTLEPCPMCAGALVAARLGRLVFGAADPKAGACGSLYNLCADPRLNHEVPVTAGVRADEAAAS